MQSLSANPVPLPIPAVLNDTVQDMTTVNSLTSNVTNPSDDISLGPGGKPFIAVTRKSKRPRQSSKDSLLMPDDIRDKQSEPSQNTIAYQQLPPMDLVLFRPTDVNVSITTINPLRLSGFLENQASSSIIKVRLDSRKNLIAVDTHNRFTTRVLLKLTSLFGIEVCAYEPWGSEVSVGTIHNLDAELSVFSGSVRAVNCACPRYPPIGFITGYSN